MADISKISINGTEYDIKDSEVRRITPGYVEIQDTDEPFPQEVRTILIWTSTRSD